MSANGTVKLSSIALPANVRVIRSGTLLPNDQWLTATRSKNEHGETYVFIKEFGQWHSSSIFEFYIFTTPN